MKLIRFGFSLLFVIALSACGGADTPSGPTLTPLAKEGDDAAPTVTESVTLTAAPTADALTTPTTPEPEAQPPAIVVYQAGDPASIVVVDSATGQIAPFISPAPTILGGSNTVDALQGKIYAMTGSGSADDPYVLLEITPAGTTVLGSNPAQLSSIATHRANEVTMIAGAISDGATATLNYFAVDALGGAIIAEQPVSEGALLPLRWSADGSRLYYSVQQAVASGYGALLGGFSALYSADISTRASNVIIPRDSLPADLCLDDLSPDETLVVHHCAEGGIGILDLDGGNEVAIIQPPADIEWTMAGSSKFSPESARVAFAVVRGDPANEQGWVLVTDYHSASRLIATAPAGDYFTVEAWLDANTLILQSHGETPAVWLIRLDGSNPVKLTDGVYLDLMR